uniref:InlB B-repeat-containing protein n=1 Tax=Lysinibacillus boronitolerans TaxID=309788 RepID=UPI001FD1AED0
ATNATLRVGASVSDGGILSYQWYSNTTNSPSGGTPISGATNPIYAAPTSTIGTMYYYVVVTNTNSGVSGNQTATETSNVVGVTVNALVNAETPAIGTQPAGKTVNQGATNATLSVGASVSDGGTLSYQWYSNTTNSTNGGTPISGATNATYAAPTFAVGTVYYYVLVTNTNSGVSGNQTATETSNVVGVTVNALVNAETPAIGTQPAGKTVNQGATNATLSVGASVSDGGTLSYQWYSNTTNSTSGGTPISGATNATYAAPTFAVGTMYYYVVVTNTNSGVSGNQTATATSNVVGVTVNALVNAETPAIGTQPMGATVNQGATNATLRVGASVSDGGILSYQWYSNTTNSPSGGTPISGATNPIYAAPTFAVGTVYYYVIVTNTNSGVSGSQTAITTSSVVPVIVNSAQTITVTYNGNTNTAGTVPTDSETYEQGETVTVLGNTGNLVKVGYTFEGWNTQADGRGIDYAPASTFLMGSGSIILYAKWKPVIVTYTVRFDVAGGSPVSNQTVVHEGKASQPTPAPTKAGHIFEGWYTSPAYTTPYDFNSAITRHTTIYAKWIPITYTVRFDVNGGSAVSNQTVEHGKKASQLAQEPTKAGYTFGGWYISNAYTTPYDFNSAINENTTIYAKWIPGMYTVRFDVDGGSAISDQTVEYGEKASQPKIEPTKAGYTFVGWYTNNAYTTPFKFDTAITANTVIYAKWISNDTGGGNTDPSPNPDSGSSTPSTNVEEIVVDVESGDGDLVSKTAIKRTKNVDNTINDEVTLTAQSATETIRKLKEQGNDKARIIIPDQQDQVNQVHVSVPRNVVTLLQNSAVHLEIVTDNVRIEVPKTSLETFNDNLYFRLVPIKERANQLDIKEQAKKERAVQQLAGSTVVELLGRPMTIETNMQSRPVILTLPLPTDLTREQLNHLAIYIEHSDGTKEVVRGKVVEYQKGITGLQFEVNKFSTFSILYLPEKEEVKEPTTDGVTHLPYIQGYPDGTFRPNAPVTRAQMASMFARQLTGNAIPQAKATYTDTFQHDAKDAIEFVKEKGLFKGVTATNFNPNGLITRAQMATVAARWIGQQCVERPDTDFCEPTSPSAAFKDVSFNHWAVKAIDTVNAAEIMTGVTADTFNPDGFLTRAQAVKVLNRLFERQVLTEVQTPLFTDVLRQHWAFYEIQEAAKK